MESPLKLEASFQPTYRERVQAEWTLMLENKPVLLLNALFPASGLFLLWLAFRHPEAVPGWSLLAAFLGLGFVPAIFLYNTLRGHKFTVECGPYTYSFDPEGVHVTTPLAQAVHRWPGILRVRCIRGNLLLYYSKRCAYFVPLRALPGPPATQRIQQLASAGGVPRVGT
jgi:hypothetical protein